MAWPASTADVVREVRARYRMADDAWEHEAVWRPGAAVRDECARLGLGVAHDEGRWRVTSWPACDVRVLGVRATLGLPLGEADALYLNGYNSWTDSVERPVSDSTPGIGVPRAVVRHWVLDGSGDYRFTPRDARPGHQHGYEYGYLRRGADVVLFGTLDVDSGFTAVFEDLPRSCVVLDKEPPAKDLPAGAGRELMSFCLATGTLDACVERWLGLMGVVPRPARPLVGYSSWYRHYGDISEGALAQDLDGVVAALKTRDTPGCERLFQVDDGYARVGDWLEPDAGRFPHGLAPLAASAREHGLVAGLWVAPFVCERGSQLFARHPGWLLRDATGAPVPTGSHWSGQVALDTLNPEVRAYVSRVLSTMTRDWGFRFLKCDFLYGACMLPHGGMNRGELMADALDLLRASVAPDTLLDLCGVPLGSALGRAEFCRVGCDVGLDWDANWVMRRTGRERVSTRNSLANTRGRAHLDGRAFRNDPDVFFLRRDVRLSEAQRRELLEADASLGGMLLTSDDMGRWDAEQCRRYDDALATFCARAKGERP